MVDQDFKAERVNISGRPELYGRQLGQVGHRCHPCKQSCGRHVSVFVKVEGEEGCQRRLARAARDPAGRAEVDETARPLRRGRRGMLPLQVRLGLIH